MCSTDCVCFSALFCYFAAISLCFTYFLHLFVFGLFSSRGHRPSCPQSKTFLSNSKLKQFPCSEFYPITCWFISLTICSAPIHSMIRSMAAPRGRIISAAPVHNVDSVSCVAHHGLKVQFTVLITRKGRFSSHVGELGASCALCAFCVLIFRVLLHRWLLPFSCQIKSLTHDRASPGFPERPHPADSKLSFHFRPSSHDFSHSLSPPDMSSPARAVYWGVKAELSTSRNCLVEVEGGAAGAGAKPCVRPLNISPRCLEL